MQSPYRRVSKNYAEHRMIVEQSIGRKLRREELIHHINGNGKDNRLENLQIVSAAEHAAIHLQKYAITKRCVICKESFKPHPTKRKRQQTCSRGCAGVLRSLKNRDSSSPRSKYRISAYPSEQRKRIEFGETL